MLDVESEDDDADPAPFLESSKQGDGPSQKDQDSKDSLVRRYVGELIKRVEYTNDARSNPSFVM